MTVSVHASDDRLTDLAMRLLERDEANRTLAHVRVCADCENRFREICRESEILLARSGPAVVPLEMRNGAQPHGGEQEAARVRRRAIWGGVAAAAAIVLVAAVVVGLRRDDGAIDYWLPVDRENVVARSEAPAGANALVAEVIEAYRLRDTGRVVALLHERPIPDGNDPLKLVLASALVWEDRPIEARTLLEELDIDTLPLPARDRARWILLMAHRKDGDRSSAETILRDLASRPGEFSERARRQLTADP